MIALGTLPTDLTATLAAEAVRKLEAAGQPVQGAFYVGVMFGMESARDELAAALAEVSRQQA